MQFTWRSGSQTNRQGGFWVGLMIFLAAVPLLGWNEQRTLKMDQSIRALAHEQGGGGPVEQSSLLDGRVVFVQGRADSEQGVSDPALELAEPGLALHRIVELYQWQENRREERRTNSSGESETVVTYSYEKVWSDQLIDSGNFRRSGYHNPSSKPLESQRSYAPDAAVSGYRLAAEQIDAIDAWQSLPLEEVPAPLKSEPWQPASAGMLFLGASEGAPEVGDARIRVEWLPASDVSFVAQQAEDRLVEFQPKGGYALLLQETGRVELSEMFARAHSRNAWLAWAIRLGGFILMWVGLALALSPLTQVLQHIPVLGPLANRAFGALAFVVALVSALMVIVVGWLIARPWLIAVLVMALIAAVVLWLRARPAPVAAGSGPEAILPPAPPRLPVNMPPPPPR